MFTTAFLAVVIGCAVAQPQSRWTDKRMPTNRMPPKTMPDNMPAMPWMREGCDLQSLQSCLTPLMESPMMQRSPDMSLSSTVAMPDLEESCRLVSQFMNCVLPKIKACGPEATSAVNAVFDAVNYMCVDARNETQKYMNCLLRDNNVAKVSECAMTMMQEETAMLTTVRDPLVIMQRMCTLLERYERCAERKAGSVCNEEAYMKHVFGLFNKGLSFLNCKGLSQNGRQTPVPSPVPVPIEGDMSAGRFQMSPMEKNMKCIQRMVMSCMSPHMSLFYGGSSTSKLTVNTVCGEFGTLEGCLTRAEGQCGPQARRMLDTLKEVYNYLCFEKRQEFKESFSCLMKDMASTVNSCVKSLNSMETRGDFSFESFERAKKSGDMQDRMCRAFGSYGSCIGNMAEKRCGWKARDLIDGLQPEIYELMAAQTGIECRTDTDEIIADRQEYFGYRRHHHHRALKIALPIVGVVVVLIIVAIIVAIKRRHGAARRQQLEKADLVKNDLLQQNLRFAITQTPKEKSDTGGLKV